jgi:hypothetical protein
MTDTPTKDIHELTLMLLSALREAHKEIHPEQVTQAHEHLETHLLDYLVLMRKRPLIGAYEFLLPPNGKGVGWYWRHPKHNPSDWVNWHGPFTSRKAAAEARIRETRATGAPKTPLDVLERDIFI